MKHLGHIEITDKGIIFVYYELEKPEKDNFNCAGFFDEFGFNLQMKLYLASRREVEMNDVSKIGNQWILDSGYPFEPYPLKHNQPCQAEVNGKATILKIL